jgi:hypothetical protein
MAKKNRRVPKKREYEITLKGTYEELQFLHDMVSMRGQVLFMDSPTSYRKRMQFLSWVEGEVEIKLQEIEDEDGV